MQIDLLSPFQFIINEKTFFARKIIPSDKSYFEQAFAQLSNESKYLRFSSMPQKLPSKHLKYLTELDDTDHVAWGILDITSEKPVPAGVGRFVRLDKNSNTAEMALTVVDAYQSQGLGRILFSILNIEASRRGIQAFEHFVLSENRNVLANLQSLEVLKQKTEGIHTTLHTAVLSEKEVLDYYPGFATLRIS